jgi:hypothetical protein
MDQGSIAANGVAMAAPAVSTDEQLIVDKQIPLIGFDRLTISGGSATIKHSRGLFNINKISNWTENRLDLLRTCYLAIQKDRMSNMQFGGSLFLWVIIAYFASSSCNGGLMTISMLMCFVTILIYLFFTSEKVLLATKKAPLEGCDVSYEPGGTKDRIIDAYVRTLYGLFYGGASPPQSPEKSFTKNVLAWNVLPKGKDIVNIFPGHIMVERSRKFMGIGPATSSTFVVPMKNLQWLHFASTGRKVGRLLKGMVGALFLGLVLASVVSSLTCSGAANAVADATDGDSGGGGFSLMSNCPAPGSSSAPADTASTADYSGDTCTAAACGCPKRMLQDGCSPGSSTCNDVCGSTTATTDGCSPNGGFRKTACTWYFPFEVVFVIGAIGLIMFLLALCFMIMMYVLIAVTFVGGLFGVSNMASSTPCMFVPAVLVYVILAAWSLYWFLDKEKYLNVGIDEAPLAAPMSSSPFAHHGTSIGVALPAISNGGVKPEEIAAEFLPRMLGRPVDATKIASWKGTQETGSEITLYKDFITVEFFETACGCFKSCVDTQKDFYFILLRDVQHVNVGVTQDTTLLLVLMGFGIATVFGFFGFLMDLFSCGASACAAMFTTPFIGTVFVGAAWMYTKRATISIGVHPGGATHAFGNPFGDDSPFHVNFAFATADVSAIQDTIKAASDASKLTTAQAGAVSFVQIAQSVAPIPIASAVVVQEPVMPAQPMQAPGTNTFENPKFDGGAVQTVQAMASAPHVADDPNAAATV